MNEVANHASRSKECAIHPATPLLHKDGQIWGSIRESFGIRYVLHRVASVLFDVDLQAHDTVFSKIFVGLSTARDLLARHILKEHVKGCALDSLPPEDTVGSWQN